MIGINNKDQTLINDSSQIEVVIVPLAAHGHLNQLLHLARLIADRSIDVHYAAAATHVRQAKLRIHGWNPNSSINVHFHDVNIPPFPSPPPNPAATHKFPSHILPSVYASSSQLRRPVGDLILKLSSRSRRVVVIHDSLMTTTVQDACSLPNVEAYTFHTVSGFAVFMFFWEAMGLPFKEEAMQHIPEDVPSLEGCFPDDFLNFITEQYGSQTFSSGNILNTSRVIEKPYMEFIDKMLEDKKNWAIGPFNPVELLDSKMSNKKHMCLDWLDKQAPNTVVYVSFGTTTTFSSKQIEELALGLEQSGQKFIWVLREADKGDVFDGEEAREIELPLGFEKRVKENGVVVRDWAPQQEVLAHPATGGFLSHCGWNSCAESITHGVPMGTWPMHSDQPRNTSLVTNVLKIGVVVREWERRDEVANAARVSVGVRRLMASTEGIEARRRAAELGCAVRGSMADEGGVSRMELDSFIAHITR